MPSPQGQNVMTDGPGLKDRARETNAILNAVSPVADPPKRVNFEPTPAEKINPKAKFGSRPGEKRIDTSDMTKPLGSFKKGTNYVPKTGVYKLHEGEKVVTAEDNKMNPYSKVTEGAKKPKKVVKSIHTRRASSGGWIHEHHHTEPAHHPMEEHTTAAKNDMLSHMDEHAGSMPDASEQTPEQSQDAAVGA